MQTIILLKFLQPALTSFVMTGELAAQCFGPHKIAVCELVDHHDGTFTLNVKPQEHGRHSLHIKYGGNSANRLTAFVIQR